MSDPKAAEGAIKDRREVQRMFGRIVKRYDLMNRLMTGGMDVRWRRKAVRQALAAGDAGALDVATGTGDLAFALTDGGFRRVVGLYFAPEMIAAAKRENRWNTAFVVGDAMQLPFADGAFDACTVSFGLRNMPDYGAAVREMSRVVKPGGRLVCLELTPLRRPVVGRLFRFYFTRVVPVVGGLLSGDREAYRYLPASVAAFPDAESLVGLMMANGFELASFELVGGGTVAIHVATKAS